MRFPPPAVIGSSPRPRLCSRSAQLPRRGEEVPEKRGEVGISGVEHHDLRAKIGGAGEGLLKEHPRQRPFVLVVGAELVQLRMPAWRTDRHWTVCMHALHRHSVEPAPEARQLLRLGAKAKLKRVETERFGFIGDGGTVVEAAITPVCGKSELHYPAILT